MNKSALLSLLPRLAPCLLALCLLLAAGCGPSNTVRLQYKPAESGVLPAPGAPSVTVVQFEDKRPNTQLGVRRDSSTFVGTTPVAEWLSRSLGDELARLGMQVTYATSIDQARAGHPDYIVSGDVSEVWLKESSSMEISASLRATMHVSGRKGRLLVESLSASQTKKGLPSSDAAEALMLDTMQELVQPAARKVEQTIMKK